MAGKQRVVPLMTRSRAQARVRELAQDSSNVILGKHAKDRMLEREITNTDVLRVLRTGTVDEGPSLTEHNELKVKMVLQIRGAREGGVIAIVLHGDRIFVKTVEWEDMS